MRKMFSKKQIEELIKSNSSKLYQHNLIISGYDDEGNEVSVECNLFNNSKTNLTDSGLTCNDVFHLLTQNVMSFNYTDDKNLMSLNVALGRSELYIYTIDYETWSMKNILYVVDNAEDDYYISIIDNVISL